MIWNLFGGGIIYKMTMSTAIGFLVIILTFFIVTRLILIGSGIGWGKISFIINIKPFIYRIYMHTEFESWTVPSTYDHWMLILIFDSRICECKCWLQPNINIYVLMASVFWRNEWKINWLFISESKWERSIFDIRKPLSKDHARLSIFYQLFIYFEIA